MYTLIQKMMGWANVTEEELKDKKIISTSFGTTFYWDYYSFTKDNIVNNWRVSTDIICGDKDDMQDHSLLINFTDKYDCNLYTLKDGEHYFHTKSQLDYYRICLEKIIK